MPKKTRRPPASTHQQLTIGSFHVRALAVENNVRGQSMRRVHLTATSGEALESPLPDGVPQPGPDATLHALLNPKAAAFLELGADYDVILVRKQA